MSKIYNKILIIQTAFIGDAILATALVEKLRNFYPNTKIDVLVRKGNEVIFETNPHVNEILAWDKKNNKYLSLLKTILQVRKRKYDIVVNVQRFFSSGLITSMSNAPIKSGFKKNPLSFFLQNKAPHAIDGTHEIERNQKLIEFITDSKPVLPKIYITDPVEFEVQNLKVGKYICIAPASVWFTKQYPENKWIELIQQLKPETTVYLLGSKGDSLLCQRMVEKTGKHVKNLCGKLSLLESAALMKDAVMNFVNDSAPLHLCSSIDAPVTAVFCSTTPKFGFGPLGASGIVVEAQEPLACRPCGLHGKKQCPEKHFNCAALITAKQLLDCIPIY
jgi:heptosyltransferase-2